MAMRKLELSPSERLVLISVLHFTNKDGTGAHPSQSRLERMTGFTRRSVIRILNRLVSRGILSRKANPGGVCHYTVTPDTMSHVTDWVGGVTSTGTTDTGSQGVGHRDTPTPDTGSHDHTHKIIPKDLKETHKEKAVSKPSLDLQFEKSRLSTRYSEELKRILGDGFRRVAKTRKTGKISESVKVKILRELDKYHPNIVRKASEIFCKTTGKKENYWIGICRTMVQENAAKAREEAKVKKFNEDPSLWYDGSHAWSREDLERWDYEMKETKSRQGPMDFEKVARVAKAKQAHPEWNWA